MTPLKRLSDIFFAVLLAFFLSPVLVATGLAILILDGRPIFYISDRAREPGRTFRLVKFRTMRPDPSDSGASGGHKASRITCSGSFLRKSRLDEVPQLWNILKGEMSLVGPRPLLMSYLPLYSPEQARRHDVPPGITGWSQVKGRNALGWDQKLALDVWYVDHWSPWLDVKILALTVAKVLRRDGVSADGHATMPPFTGSGSERSGEVGTGSSNDHAPSQKSG